MVKISPRSYMVDTLHCTPYTVRSGSPAPPTATRGPAVRGPRRTSFIPVAVRPLIFLKMSYN